MELAGKCVMDELAWACAELETLPQLTDVRSLELTLFKNLSIWIKRNLHQLLDLTVSCSMYLLRHNFDVHICIHMGPASDCSPSSCSQCRRHCCCS